MKGLICFCSGSGNTRLACQHLAKKVTAAEWTTCDMLKDAPPDPAGFDVVGLACFTDFWGVPQRCLEFLKGLPKQEGRTAFTLTTFGFASGFALRDLGRAARARGFKTVAGFALHTPENYPPMICHGHGMEDSPSPRELRAFEGFLSRLDRLLRRQAAGQVLKGARPGESYLLALMPAPFRTSAREDMGRKFVDEGLCSQCGACATSCPFKAIKLDPYPQFDQQACYGCWHCFHHCARKAIYTNKFRGRGHCPRPVKQLVDKLG